MIKTCKRCGVTIIGDRVVFSFRPDLSATHEELSRKVCQWAYKADKRNGVLPPGAQCPVDCANPLYDPTHNYGAFDDGAMEQLGLLSDDSSNWRLPDQGSQD